MIVSFTSSPQLFFFPSIIILVLFRLLPNFFRLFQYSPLIFVENDHTNRVIYERIERLRIKNFEILTQKNQHSVNKNRPIHFCVKGKKVTG